MIAVQPYEFKHKAHWDRIVAAADNGHFMFNRDFMEYHSDRFRDLSLVVYYKDHIVGAIPGNLVDKCWYSHQGLTFGGLLLDPQYNRITIAQQALESALKWLQQNRVSEVVYKFIPHIYHQRPCDADIYVLSKYKRIEDWTEVSSAVNLQNISKFSELRIRGKNKANKNGLVYAQSDAWEDFWNILIQRLSSKYAKKPVHSLEEIVLLQQRFPDNIKLFVAQQDQIYAGVVIFETATVAHCQYICASDTGMQNHSLDGLFAFLIDYYGKQSKHYFNFGISTENYGKMLNDNLVQFKEGFGAKSMIHCTYKLSLEE